MSYSINHLLTISHINPLLLIIRLLKLDLPVNFMRYISLVYLNRLCNIHYFTVVLVLFLHLAFKQLK